MVSYPNLELNMAGSPFPPPEPSVVTLTVYPLSRQAARMISRGRHGTDPRDVPFGIGMLHSPNTSVSALVMMNAYLLRQLGNRVGLEGAFEAVKEAAMGICDTHQRRLTGDDLLPSEDIEGPDPYDEDDSDDPYLNVD